MQRGFSYIEFLSEEAADAARQDLNGQDFNGHILSVNFAEGRGVFVFLCLLKFSSFPFCLLVLVSVPKGTGRLLKK